MKRLISLLLALLCFCAFFVMSACTPDDTAADSTQDSQTPALEEGSTEAAPSDSAPQSPDTSAEGENTSDPAESIPEIADGTVKDGGSVELPDLPI